MTTEHATSMGHVLSSARWLDHHFEACRFEYAEMLAWAGLQPGMRVLDAGCGSGSYLPLMQQVGVEEIVALDTAIEHLSSISQHSSARQWLPVCGSITGLPISHASLDAIWCANTLQFLDDDDAVDALRDFARAVRPGGLIAVKDVDMTAFKFSPAPPFLGLHLAEACASGDSATDQSLGSIRGRELRRLLGAAGLSEVRQRSFVIERFGPLQGHDAQFWSEWLPYLANLAEAHDVPEDDMDTWRKVATPALAEAFVTDPGFYGCEVQVVCAGRTPA